MNLFSEFAMGQSWRLCTIPRSRNSSRGNETVFTWRKLRGCSDAELMKENAVSQFGLSQDLVPRQHLDIKIDVLDPLKPAEFVRHDLEVLLAQQPVFNFCGEVTDHITIEGGIRFDQHLAASGRLRLPISDVVHVSHDLLDRVFFRREVHKVVSLRLLEFEYRDWMLGSLSPRKTTRLS